MKFLIQRTVYWTLEVEADSLEEAENMGIDTGIMDYQGEDDQINALDDGGEVIEND